MPRFFFDVQCRDGLVVDEVGEELDGPDTALEVALALLHCVEPGEGPVLLDTTVRDEEGRTVLIATLSVRYQRFDRPGPTAPPAGPPAPHTDDHLKLPVRELTEGILPG